MPLVLRAERIVESSKSGLKWKDKLPGSNAYNIY
jgi:hypothetical protein